MNAPAPPPAFAVRREGSVTSTNDVARAAAEAGAAAGLLVVAERQTAGRGRHGRSWASPPGNLHASLLLRPRRPTAELASLSLVVAVALAECVESLLGPIGVRVKWPNDVLVRGAKVAGILLESSADADGRCRWLIVGIGVNVRWSPGAGVGYPTTDLLACGLADARAGRVLDALTGVLGGALATWEEAGFAPFRERWLARAAGLGDALELRSGRRTVRGRLVGVDATGAVVLRTDRGGTASFAAGELVLGPDAP